MFFDQVFRKFYNHFFGNSLFSNSLDERSTNSVENGQQIAGTKFEDEILPDTIVPNRTSDMVDSKDIRDAAEYRDTMEDIQNRGSSVSQDTERFVNSEIIETF